MAERTKGNLLYLTVILVTDKYVYTRSHMLE